MRWTPSAVGLLLLLSRHVAAAPSEPPTAEAARSEASASKPQAPKPSDEGAEEGREGQAPNDEAPPDDGARVEPEPIDVIVTTSRVPSTQHPLRPALATVIDREELKKRPMLNADDLLRTRPSTTIERYQGQSNAFPHLVAVRGIRGADRTLFVIDGMPINNAFNGYPNLNMMPTERVARIEVVRGPYSALYGSQALGGVVHLVTLVGARDPGVTATAAVGTEGATVLGVSGGRRFDAVEVSLSYERRRIDDYLGGVFPVNTDYEHHRMHGRLDVLRGEDYSLTVSAGGLLSDSGFNQQVDLREVEGLGYLLRNEGRNEKNSGYARAQLQLRPVPELTVVGAVGTMRHLHDYVVVPVILEGESPPIDTDRVRFDSQRHRLELLARYDATEWLSLLGGLDQDWFAADWNLRDRAPRSPTDSALSARASLTSGLLQAELSFFDDALQVAAGGRLDRHSSYGLTASPKLSLSWLALEQLRVHASGGGAFRAPTLAELYSPAWTRIPPYELVGNPALEPERLWSGDGGLEWRPLPELTTRAVGFYSEGVDFIALRLGTDGVERYANFDRVRTAGAELEAEVAPLDWLRMLVSYTYTYTRNLDFELSLDGVPSHLVGGTVMLNRRLASLDWGLAFDVRGQSSTRATVVRIPESNRPEDIERQTLPPIAVGNLRASVGYRNVTAFADFYNLWDTRYEVTPGVPAARFLALFGVRATASLDGDNAG